MPRGSSVAKYDSSRMTLISRICSSSAPPRPSARDASSISRYVRYPSSGSCCPMDVTRGRERSMLIFQYILRPPNGEA